jgi:hypothetical protein
MTEDEAIRVSISAITYDEICETWGTENGLHRMSPRWEPGKRLMHARLSRDEAASLKRYLKGVLDLRSGPNFDKEPGEIPRLRRDVARLSGV